MRAVIKSEAKPGFDYVEDYPNPKAGPLDVVVEIHSASICGTDRELYDWSASGAAFNPTLPIVQGHEAAGTIVEVGSGVSDFEVGGRVAFESHVVCETCRECRMGLKEFCPNTQILGMHHEGVFAEYIAIPAHACFPLPDAISLECGALMESAGVAAHALQRVGYATPGANVLVSGMGPVGLAVAVMAKQLGAKKVFATEPNQYRADFARQFGIEVMNPMEGDPKEHFEVASGFDLSFETSGAKSALPMMIEDAATNGTVLAIAHPGEPTPVEIAKHINKRGVTLRGLFGRQIWQSWMFLADLQSEGVIDLTKFITHRVKLEDYKHAMDLLRGDACKVLFQPGL